MFILYVIVFYWQSQGNEAEKLLIQGMDREIAGRSRIVLKNIQILTEKMHESRNVSKRVKDPFFGGEDGLLGDCRLMTGT